MSISKDTHPSSDIIRASEIGEYVWCHRAWWLGRVVGVPNANRAQMEAGIERHRAHGHRVQRAMYVKYAAIGLAVIAVIVALLLLLRVVGFF